MYISLSLSIAIKISVEDYLCQLVRGNNARIVFNEQEQVLSLFNRENTLESHYFRSVAMGDDCSVCFDCSIFFTTDDFDVKRIRTNFFTDAQDRGVGIPGPCA